MKLYRYLSEQELNFILTGELDKIGSFYNRNDYKRVSNHKYKKDTKYLHFYFDKKEISRISHLGFQAGNVCYVGEFEIPFYLIFSHIGVGKYDGHGFDLPYDEVYEVALPAKLMKTKYLVSYEKDKNSGPVDFGPIIKFDRKLYEPICFDDKKEESSQENEEMGL